MHITVTEIGEFIRYNSCERRLKLAYNKRAEAEKLPFYSRLFNAIDPVLQQVGKEREDEWANKLKQKGLLEVLVSKDEESEISELHEFINYINNNFKKGQNVFIREITLKGTISKFEVSGRLDFLLLLWENNLPKIRIVECKASRKDKTYHRVQIATYKILLEILLANLSINLLGYSLKEINIESVVGRINEDTNVGQNILKIPSFQLDREMSDVLKILEINGLVERTVNTDVDELDFSLAPKCDDCIFNVHCLSESGRLRKLHLLGIDNSSIKVLHKNNILSIDELADIELTSSIASDIRNDTGFSQNLNFLKKKAKARRNTLPHSSSSSHKGEFSVMKLDNSTARIPTYEQGTTQLIRIYMGVDYDYVENRIAAISAHITNSDKKLFSRYTEADIVELDMIDDKDHYSTRNIVGESIINIIPTAWTGIFAQDNGMELNLLQSFFNEIVNKIASVSEESKAHIHFYVWSRGEIKSVMEACTRLGSGLLERFQNLLGCREKLEQLIFSCLEDEISNNYGLGWTGRGLSVISSLYWYESELNKAVTYSWRRKINGKAVDLSKLFTQDIFDFKTDLLLNTDNTWADSESNPSVKKHKFEIRSRFRDSLSVPYFHAYWETLPNANNPLIDASLKSALDRYSNASIPNYLETYLKSRMWALRWIEEKLSKNSEIQKPSIELAKLRSFSLNVHNTRKSAINFILFDFYVKFNDWLNNNLLPPINRVSKGDSIPLKDIIVSNVNELEAVIDIDLLGIDIKSFKTKSSIQKDSWARLSPYSGNLEQGQTNKQLINAGITCKIEFINWNTGEVKLKCFGSGKTASEFIIQSWSFNSSKIGSNVYPNGILDASITDFVGNRVYRRLNSDIGNHVNEWFDPKNQT